MPNLDALEQEINNLNSGSSSFTFRKAFTHIDDEAKTTDGNEITRLRGLVSVFGQKIPDLPTFHRLDRDTEDLADTLMLATLAQRIDRINARNQALSDLTESLQEQIDKANGDADLLTRIKDAVDKASKTVAEVKLLVDQLTATDASTKDELKAFIDALGNISSIFNPNGA